MNETTQFGMAEYRAYEAEGMPFITDGQATFKTPRHKAMAAFASFLKTDAGVRGVAGVGGIGNLQRVRVFGPDSDGNYQFVLVKKVPVSILKKRERKAQEAEQAKKRAEYLVQLEAIRNDPERLEAFLDDVVVAVLSRQLAVAYLEAARAAKKHGPNAQKPKVSRDSKRPPKPRVDPRKDFNAGFDAAVRQDYKRRVEAYHKKSRAD